MFFVNSGAEANENALKMAFRINPKRTHVAALEYSFHGRTAAAGALTWGAAQKWYALPRTPFDVSFMPRKDIDAIAKHVTENTAAVIVEPVQGLAGAYDFGAEYLAALRKRCDETGALLIFDEVQCGTGRVGHPFAADLYGVKPDMITAAKALGNGFPCAALLTSPKVSAAIKLDSLGTTYGGGPMACAAIEACIDAIESADLLGERAQGLGLHPQDLHRRSGHGRAGRRLPARPAHDAAGEGDSCGAARSGHSRRHEHGSEHPAPAAALHPGGTARRHACRRAVAPPMKRFLDLADFSRDEVRNLLELARRLETVAGAAGAGWQDSRPRVLQPVAAHARLVPGGHVEARWHVVRDHARAGHLAARDALGAVMNGAAAEHVREGIPVLASYCDALGIRAFADGKNLQHDLNESRVQRDGGGGQRSRSSISSRPMNHPCQALADWKTMDDLGVARNGKFVLSWVYHPRGLPLAVPAAALHMAAQRGMEVVVARPEGYALPPELMSKARKAAEAVRRLGARDERSARSARRRARAVREGVGLHAVLRRSEADGRLRANLTDWCVKNDWFATAAADCRLMHCLPVRRNTAVADEVLDGPRSVVQRKRTTASSSRWLCSTSCSEVRQGKLKMMNSSDQTLAIAALKRAAPYIRMYKGKTFVVKAGGGVFADTDSTVCSSSRSPSCITSACAS